MIDLIQWRATIGSYYAARCYRSKTVGTVLSWRWVLAYCMMSATVIAVIQMLILLCCDVETNPGPTLVLTAANAVTVLEKSGFVVKEQWSNLARHLGVPLSEREKLIEKAARTQDYFTVLEETLEWWISNQQSSWEMLVSSVDTCGDSSTADNMRKQLGLHLKFQEVIKISHLITIVMTDITMAYQMRNLDHFLKFRLTGFRLSGYSDTDKYGEPQLSDMLNMMVAEIPGLWELVASLLLPEGQVQAIKRNISLGGDCKLFFKEALVKWESTRYKPYMWRTILDILSAPVIGHKALADKIAGTLRNRQNSTSDYLKSSKPPTLTVQSTQTEPICTNIATSSRDNTERTIPENAKKQAPIQKLALDDKPIFVNYKVARDITRLKARFSNITYQVSKALISENVPVDNLKTVVEGTRGKLIISKANCNTLTIDALFEQIQPSFCYINYTLLESIIDTFLKRTPIHSEFKQYSDELEEFMESTTLHDLIQQVEELLNTDKVVKLKLSRRWDNVTVMQFKQLINILFNEEHLTHMTVTEGCLCITWAVFDTCIRSTIVTKRAYNTDFMCAIGVLHLTVGDTVIYETLEQESTAALTLDEALLKTLNLESAGPISAVELLLAVGGNPNLLLPSGDDDTVISRAAEIRDSEGYTVLQFACYWGHYDVAMLLLRANANPNIPVAKNGWTPLLMASDKGYDDIVELLVNAKVNVNAQADDGATALNIACRNGHLKIASILLHNRANFALAKNDGWTPLMMACHYDHIDIVKLLVSAQVDVDVQNIDGATALYIACQNGHERIASVLLNANAIANPHITTYNGTTPLMAASDKGHDSTVELLVNADVDINACCKFDSFTALYFASQNGHSKVVATLLDAHADPSITTSEGWTPLMVASYDGHTDVVRLLINCSVDVNTYNKSGATALYIACQNGHLQTARMLLHANANPLIAKTNGNTPLLIASSKGHTDIVELLVSTSHPAKIDVNAKNCDGTSPLYIACQYGHSKIISILLNSNADPNIVTSDGWTPLMIASSMADISTILLLLLQYDADINYSTAAGETALSCASDDNVFQILLDCGADVTQLQVPQSPQPLEVPQEQEMPPYQPPAALTDIAYPLVQQEPKHDNNMPSTQEADSQAYFNKYM